MTSILEIAVQAAKLAGESIVEGGKNLSSLNIEQKTIHDYVSEVDRQSERIIVDHIQRQYPDHVILGEEYGEQGVKGGEYQWVIDPLDGTTNFLRGIPHYAVSIGVLHKGCIEHGVIFDPIKQDLFTASKGQGAVLNGEVISVSASNSISGALLATGVPFSGENLEKLRCFTDSMEALLRCQTSGIRRLGAAALDLAYVAAGRYDGFWEANLKIWDICAGALIVQEAGGVVSGLQGDENYLNTGHILAAPIGVHNDMLEITSRCYAEPEFTGH